MRQEHKLPVLADSLIRQRVSHGSSALTTLATALEPTHPAFDQHKTRFLDRYEISNGQHTRLFPGMADTLAWLAKHHIPWGIVTNKPIRFTTPLLHALNLTHPAQLVVCPDHVEKAKPHPDALFLGAEQLDIPASHCIYVGDHERDIIAGKSAGMLTIAALYGYIDQDEQPDQWNYDVAVHDSQQLLPLLQSLLTPHRRTPP
ncbi:MAG: HAD-IA family hydrolase [Gammaproteobacteria bacterium]